MKRKYQVGEGEYIEWDFPQAVKDKATLARKQVLWAMFVGMLLIAYAHREKFTATSPPTFTSIGAFPIEIAETETILPDDDEQTKAEKEYINRFSKIAKIEHDKYGVLPSIKIAQGLVESNAGRSLLAQKANNHFGMKCFSRSCGKGHCVNLSDDHHKDYFRKYKTAWESWRAHSQLLDRKYKACLKKSWRGCAACLKEKGYATASHYEQALVKMIEKHKLYKYDKK